MLVFCAISEGGLLSGFLCNPEHHRGGRKAKDVKREVKSESSEIWLGHLFMGFDKDLSNGLLPNYGQTIVLVKLPGVWKPKDLSPSPGQSLDFGLSHEFLLEGQRRFKCSCLQHIAPFVRLSLEYLW